MEIPVRRMPRTVVSVRLSHQGKRFDAPHVSDRE
jgi:hypothetical protein